MYQRLQQLKEVLIDESILQLPSPEPLIRTLGRLHQIQLSSVELAAVHKWLAREKAAQYESALR